MTGREERGQTSVLIIGLAVVIVMLVGVVVDASAAYLRRQGLDSLADGAALAGADGVLDRQIYENGLADHARIDPATARVFVADYLREVGAAAKYPGLAYAVTATEESVVVRVSAPLELPITPPGWERRPTISATAAAFVAVSD